MSPLISIVTINLNNSNGLEKTINSVFAQDYRNIEYIIIDGGSIDGSVEFIKEQSDRLNYWVTESDNGIYDAMNKGIAVAKGDYLLFLNSGDYLYSSKSLTYLVTDNDNEDIIYGDMGMYVDNSLQIKKYPQTINIKYFQYDTIPHQCTLIKRTLFDEFGYYNLSFKIISDWAFFVDVFIKGKARYRYKANLISIFDLNGISSQPSSNAIIRNEINDFLKNKYWSIFIYFKLLWAISYYPKRILREFGFKSV